MKATLNYPIAALRRSQQPYPIWSVQFALSYIVTMRPYLLFVSGITAIVGLSFIPSVRASSGLLIATAGFLSYGFGQALTDCTQTDTDAISSPYRPLVRGDVSKLSVAIVSILGLLAIAAVYVRYSPETIVLLLSATAGLATYTWFKRRWWGGPFWNSWIVVALAIASYMAAQGAQSEVYFVVDNSRTALVTALGVVFFGYANFVVTGYFKDIAADAATGYDTLLVHFGRRASAIVSDGLGLGAVALTIVTWSLLGGFRSLPVPALLFLIVGIEQALLAQWNLHHVHSDATAHHAIVPVVHVYLLLLSSIVLVLHPDWKIGTTAFLIAYLVTLRFRPLASQI